MNIHKFLKSKSAVLLGGITALAWWASTRQPQSTLAYGQPSNLQVALTEVEVGDPGQTPETLKISQAQQNELEQLYDFPTRQLKINRKKLALETLRVAKTYVGVSRTQDRRTLRTRLSPPKQVAQFLSVYGLPLRYRNGDWVPYCAAGAGFAATQAYCNLAGISYNRGNLVTIFRAHLVDVKSNYAYTHPACRFMIADARKQGMWLPYTSSLWKKVKPGWLVFYNWNPPLGPRKIAQHVGIVDVGKATSKGVYTIEFNTSLNEGNRSNGGAVALKTPLVRPSKYILGYIKTY